MLRQEQTEEIPLTLSHQPSALSSHELLKKDLEEEVAARVVAHNGSTRPAALTDPRVETFLNKKLGPITGTVSYHERLQMRDELRQEVESRAAAHMELGSTRDQAINFALASLDTPATSAVAQKDLTPRTRAVRALRGENSLVPALWAFSTSAFAALMLVALSRNTSGADAPMILSMMLAGFPFLAGMRLGSRGTRRPLQGLLLSQLLLYVPVTVAFGMLINSEVGGGPTVLGTAFWTAIYFSVSTMVGSVGVHSGKWLKKKVTNRRRK